MIELNNEQDFKGLIEEPTIVMFTAGWCPDCHYIEPALPEIEAENDDYQFVSVNRDEFMDLAVELDVMGIPSFIAFKDGNETGRFVSKNRKTKDEINQFIQSL